MLPSIEQRLALELAAKPVQVAAAIALLDEGATVPFIARYRKEVTGGLDDVQLRLLEERLRYLRELESRRAAIIASIEEQGKMTPVLLDAITHAEDKTRLEDLYLPYKPKRRTKAQIAAEAGLTELADALLNDPTLNPEEEAAKFIKPAFTTDNGDNPGVPDTKAALDGARQILMERFSEDAELLQSLREYLTEHGVVESKVIEGKQDAGEKFADYFDYSETYSTIPRTAPGAVPWPPRRDAERHPAPGYRRRSRSGMPRTIPAKVASLHVSVCPTRAVRPTSGSPTRCAGPGA
jgi:uncharacterized protein